MDGWMDGDKTMLNWLRTSPKAGSSAAGVLLLVATKRQSCLCV